MDDACIQKRPDLASLKAGLDEVTERLAHATDGPWEVRGPYGYGSDFYIYRPSDKTHSQNPIAKIFGRVQPGQKIHATDRKQLALIEATVKEAEANAASLASLRRLHEIAVALYSIASVAASTTSPNVIGELCQE